MFLTDAFNLKLTQSEVDFVIPNLERDINLYVDPFLFYKSRNSDFQAVHATLHGFFKTAIKLIRDGDKKTALRMMAFPEVKETMLGLSLRNHLGRGMGKVRGEIIYNELAANPDVQEKGISHLAEMQLLIEGVGFDLISDMCTNIAKPFFIDYTQRQCYLHNIPMEKDVCLEHIFDWDDLSWDDELVELPVNPVSGDPILLVPKSVVRRFPVFDYKSFWNLSYRHSLRAIEVDRSMASIGKEPKITWKEINEKYGYCKKTVVKALHEDPELRQKYVAKLQRVTEENVAPVDLSRVKGADMRQVSALELAAELKSIRPGLEDAKKYEALILRILTRLFSPPLVNPKPQVKTHDAREVMDITFYNGADDGFWSDMKRTYGNLTVVCELKNMTDLANEEFFQLAARLDEFRGKFGILISRAKDNLDTGRAYRRLHGDRKVIVTLTDKEILEMLFAQDSGEDPTTILQEMVRSFLEAA